MKYFKIVINDKPIGAVSSDDFIFRTPFGAFNHTNEHFGELVEYGHQFYRATWMVGVTYEVPYTEAAILPITEDEYKIFTRAKEADEAIDNIDDEPIEEEEQATIDPVKQNSIEYIRAAKIREMSSACRKAIESGFDLEVRDETHHFSLDTQDQLNLISLNAMAQTDSLIPYHADNEICIFYTADEIKAIVAAANKFKIYHTTYYNALKSYINALNDMAVISEITYGMDIPEEYKSDVLKTLE